MALHSSEVYRCLDKKTLVLGFEIVDLFLVFACLSVLSLLFSGVPNKFLWTWGPSLALGLSLKIGKAGKPDNYLLHLVRFHFSTGVHGAFGLAPLRTQFLNKGK